MEIKAIYFISTAAITILFLISHFGKERGWYKKKGNWFSRIMHFYAGFFVAMFWSGFTGRILSIIGLTFAAGVLWEVAEYITGIFMKRLGRYDMMPKKEDTIEDLICDILGACVAVLAFIIF